MSKRHRIVPDPPEPVIVRCLECGREVRQVYDRSKPVTERRYWRHVRRR